MTSGAKVFRSMLMRRTYGRCALAAAFTIAAACADTPRRADSAVARPAVAVTPPVTAVTRAPGVEMEAGLASDAGGCPYNGEPGAIGASGGVAVRHHDTLRVSRTDGRVYSFVDERGAEGSRATRYCGRLRVRAGASGDYFLLEESGSECSEYSLMNAATGRVTALGALPILSGDSAHFIIAPGRAETCGADAELSMWRMTDSVPVREWAVETVKQNGEAGWIPSALRWISADSITFVRPEPGDTAATPAVTPGFLVRRAGAWVLDSLSAAALPRRAR